MSLVFGEGQDDGGTHSSGGILKLKLKLLIERIKQGGSRIVYLKWGGSFPSRNLLWTLRGGISG